MVWTRLPRAAGCGAAERAAVYKNGFLPRAMVPFFEPHVTGEMIAAVTDAMRNEKLVMGESVYKFEEEFARYIGVRRAMSVNSGNSALFLSLRALGIGPGKRAATSTNSFVASATSISAAGAEPVLCDIDGADGGMDVSSCGRADALVPVHIYGNPCDWDSVRARAEEWGVPVVEDACQAHGAQYKGKKCGSLGAAGCFSFYTTKNMTVLGDGGMVTTDDEELADAVASMRDNGRRSASEHDRLGYTMRLNTANAAAGRVQLRALDSYNARRREIARAYRKRADPALFLRTAEGCVFHQIVARHPRRDAVRAALGEAGIGTGIHYPVPIHRQPLYAGARQSLPEAELLAEQVFSMPSFPQLTDEQVGEAADALAAVS